MTTIEHLPAASKPSVSAPAPTGPRAGASPMKQAIGRLDAGRASGKSVIVIGPDPTQTTTNDQASTGTNQGDLR